MIRYSISDFWAASQAFNQASTVAEKHNARVRLMEIALGATGKAAEAAARSLAREGVVVVKGMSIAPAGAVEG